MTIITFVLFLSLALSHSAPCTFSLTLSFHLSFSYILLSPLLSFTLYPYLFPLALLLNDSLSLSLSPVCSSSWKGRTVRTALSTASPASAARVWTRPYTRPSPCPPRAPRPRPPSSHCPACLLPRSPEMAPPRRSQTPSKYGPSPEACMKVGVSIMSFGVGYSRLAPFLSGSCCSSCWLHTAALGIPTEAG